MKILKEKIEYDDEVVNTYSADDIEKLISKKVGYAIFGGPVVEDLSLAEDAVNLIKNDKRYDWSGSTDEEVINETYYISFVNEIKDDAIVKRILKQMMSALHCVNLYGPIQYSGSVVYILQQ